MLKLVCFKLINVFLFESNISSLAQEWSKLSVQNGATIFSITTFSIMALSVSTFSIITLSINDIEHN